MEAKLIVIGGKSAGQEIPVPGTKFFIGRAEDCQLRPRSPMVSRHHSLIVIEPGAATIRDLGSSNGTYVNGEKIQGTRQLKAGDHVKIGPLEFEIQLTVSVGGKKKPKIHSIQEAAARTVESAADKDLDITGWLSDEDEDEGPGDVPKTSPGSASQETRIVEASDTVAAPAGEPKKEEASRMFGPPPPPKPTSASSRTAAADMLKQYFHRKP